MKVRIKCGKCGRTVTSNNGIISKHRTKKGNVNKRKETKAPYCSN